MSKALMDYPHMCGSCIHFEYLVSSNDGELKYRGKCRVANRDYFMHTLREKTYKARHSDYRQASNPACKKYMNGEHI